MKEGRFDIAESSDSKSSKVDMIKNVAIAVLAIVVLGLAVKIAVSNGSSGDVEDGGDFGSKRPLPPPSNSKNRNGNDICMNEQCINAADSLFEHMNLEADPCEDFNEFACGRFLKEFTIPEDKRTWSSFTPISETIYDRAKVILEEPISSDDWESEKMAKRHYKACLDEDRAEELGVEPLKQTLDLIFEGWPVLKGASWSSSSFKWYQAVNKLKENGYSSGYIVSPYIYTDLRNSSRRVIYLDQPSLGLSREYLIKGIDDKDVQSYLTYMKKTAQLLGADSAAAEEQMTEALKFELELAEASAPREERRNKTKMYNPYVLGEFESLPGHPPSWLDFINAKVLGVEVTASDRVIVENPTYVSNVSAILTSTDDRVIANYLGWRMSQQVMQLLNKDAREIRQEYRKAILGVKADQPRWKTCVEKVGFNSYTDSNLRVAAASMYVKRHFSKEAKEEMINMIKYIKGAFGKMLNALDWMDDVTKSRAREKMEKMSEFIAYPDEILEKSVVDGFHEGLDIKDDDYYGNVARLAKWRNKYDDSLLRVKVDKKHWERHSLVALVNAFYSPTINSMEFPAGILQGVFFDHRVPRYLNFGGIGAVIGHELTHGFDDQGRQYDGDGNLADWWAPETKAKFVEKTKCVIDQYGSYKEVMTGLNLNGVTTQGENIADNGGTKEAYIAYEDWIKDNEEEAGLPGFDFNPRQLFWISWGQVWCSKYREAAMKNQIKTGAHSPGLYRIIGPLSNSAEFASAFNCKKGSKMNPENKCTVW